MSDEAMLGLPCRVCGRVVGLAASKEGSVLKCPYCGARSVFARPLPCPVCGHERVLARHKQGKPMRCPRCRAVSVFDPRRLIARTSATGSHGGYAFQGSEEASASPEGGDAEGREEGPQEAGGTARTQTAREEEQMHAEVLGLQGRVKASDVKRAYRELLAKYHPDRVGHLGDEFKQIAEQKTREVLAAYKYFSRKYDIE